MTVTSTTAKFSKKNSEHAKPDFAGRVYAGVSTPPPGPAFSRMSASVAPHNRPSGSDCPPDQEGSENHQRPSKSHAADASRRRTWRCPVCGKIFGIRIPLIHGGVGTTLYKCRGCENITRSGLKEWYQRNRGEKRWFIAISAVYTVIVTVLWTIASYLAVESFAADPSMLDEIDWIFIAGGIAMTAGLWQGYRVFASMQRDGAGNINPRRVSFWSWESNELWSVLIPPAAAIGLVLWRAM